MGLETNEKIEQLLIQFANCRQEITEMIKEIEEISKIVKSLFPDKFDTRYRMIFQERVRATTELFKTLLDMRKEIIKSIKDEIEIRRRLNKGDKIEDLEGLLNMSSIMEKIENLENKKNKSKKIKDNIPSIDELEEIGELFEDEEDK